MGWFVSGAFKANRIISDAEARRVIDQWNAEHPGQKVEYDYEREGGVEFSEADAARAAEDWGQLDRVAHTIKGNALTAGDGAMAEAAIALRKASALKDPGEADALILRLRELQKEL